MIETVRRNIKLIAVGAATIVALASYESYRGEAYIPVKGDVPTIGFGTTGGVKMGDKTDPVRALIRLNNEVQGVYADGLKKCITAPLYDHELAAYILLAYNVGVPTVCRRALPGKSPNLIDLINSGRYAEACERIEAFNRGPSPGKDANGKKIPGPVLRGLANRRAQERAICEGK